MPMTDEEMDTLAEQVVRKMRHMKDISFDRQYLASLPLAEQKRLSHIEMARFKEEKRGKEKRRVGKQPI